MPKVEGKNLSCTKCGSSQLKHRVRRLLNEKNGKHDRFGGEYYSCPCGALTFGDNGYNQRED